MRKLIYISTLFCLLCWSYSAAQEKRYTIVFYNVENLYDTINSPGVNDDEFTPQGAKNWNGTKYWKKMENLEEVFYGIASAAKSFPTIIGVAEIENRNVLDDLISMPKLARANYQIVHYDSPDARGVDVALFYRPDQFIYEGSQAFPVTIEELPNFKTRDVLGVWGTIEGEQFCFFVNHWPSRLGGQSASEFRRMAAAQVVRDALDSIRTVRPDTKFVIMGDMNDDPTNRSMTETLGAKGDIKKLQPGDLYNPYYDMFRAGHGTLAYQDAWNLFDNMIVSENLVNTPSGQLKLFKPKGNKFYGNIFNRPFLLQKSGQYKNYPLRTYVGNNFQGGYSDHFPVYLYIAK